jgi:Flp pilus assembly pilin Flp
MAGVGRWNRETARDHMFGILRTYWLDEAGQDLAEYSVLMALIALAMIVMLIDFRTAIARPMDSVRDAINEAAHG